MDDTSAGGLKLNQRLDIEIADGPGKGRYASYTVDITEDGITVAAPMLGSRIIALPVGTTLQVIYVNDFGVYGFPAEVTGKKQDATQLLVLTRRGLVTKVQRRNFVRLNTLLPVRYAIPPDIKTTGDVQPVGNEFRSGKIVEISGGGIQLAAPEKLPLHASLFFEFRLTKGPRIRTKGVIVRHIHQPGIAGEGREYYYGVRFEGLKLQLQDQLVKFIFAEQIMLRRKGLL